jgi:acyl carrier protein
MMTTSISVEENIKKIASKILRKPESEISLTATFKDMKADSLDIVQILVQVEDAYEIEIQDEDMKNVTNLEGFIKYIEIKVAEKK